MKYASDFSMGPSTVLALMEPVSKSNLNSLDDYELEARKLLRPELVNYVYGGTESGATLSRNRLAFADLLLRRRVLQEIVKVDTDVIYFGGKIESELPFFPSCINTAPMYPQALLDILKVSRSFKVPIFVSDIAIADGLDASKIPALAGKNSQLLWQIYVFTENYDTIFDKAKLAQQWGYKGLIVTVDADLNVKIGNEIPPVLRDRSFYNLTLSDLKRLRKGTSLPFIVKGIMTPEDAVLAVENGADGIVVSNHGGRILDFGESSIEALPEIVKELRSRKATRKTEIFFDGGIRRGTDILKAIALGARGCLIGRPLFSGITVDRENGAENVMSILKEELVRSAYLCGVRDLSKVSRKVVKGRA
jgi:isopentenyl diphosphate isomerase/L-lactate dehydrogenase-like FMN-dependent dehydrogenase